jgi:HEAT repeat protein
VRIGAGAVLESFAGQPALADLVDRLGELSAHADARVRADACHYLGLAGSHRARAWLEARLRDDDAEVRDIAAESLDLLANT